MSKSYYKGQRVKVRRATEPKDINWQNLPVSESVKSCNRLVTNLVTLIILGCSFGILYILSFAQQEVSDKNKQEPGFRVQALSLLIGFSISFINQVLSMIIKYLTMFEKHNTETQYQSSLAKKLVIA